MRDERKSHFFGSIVSVHNSASRYEEDSIIDGQQRLTTVSLLLLAMHNLIEDGTVKSQSSKLAEKILNDYLVDDYDEYGSADDRIKLKLVKKDRDAFKRLFNASEDNIPESNLTINYDFFCDCIRSRELTVDEIFEAVKRLVVIHIKLNQDDNPQLIFESLNSTGLALSEGDKIRNFMLMGLSPKVQDDYYEHYWLKIEQNTDEEGNRFDVSSFVRDYLSVKQQAIPAQNRVYFAFKDYVESESMGTELLLQDMLAYAKRYRILLNAGTECKALNACIRRLNRLETTVTRPFFLEVLRLQSEGKLTLDEVTEIFGITESYIFRRTMCELPTNALNKIFLTLHKDIVRYDGTDANYVEKFKFALLSKKERARFPDDAEFAAAFAARQVYQMNSKNKVYLFERLENWDTLEDKDVYRHFDAGDYSVEHIMPRQLTPAWMKELGENYKEIHSTWLHRVANLTITAYNSRYSNRAFAEKRA